MKWLTPNFSLEEFTATNHRNIDNSLPIDLVANATATCEMLERIRAYLNNIKPGTIMPLTSGYRCKALNKAVGSGDTSDHLKALAADWSARKFGTPYEVCRVLAPVMDELGIGQLIHEYGAWIHTGVSKPSKLINRIITISKMGTQVGIVRL